MQPDGFKMLKVIVHRVMNETYQYRKSTVLYGLESSENVCVVKCTENV